MRKKTFLFGFTLIEILIVVSLIAILTAISVPGLLRAKVNSNEALTVNNLRALSTAAETFSAMTGQYPLSIASLLNATPPYVNSGLCGSTVNGYSYACTFSSQGYAVRADPAVKYITGESTFTIMTGGILGH